MKQIEDLVDWFYGKEKALIALSGGVDSALVACAAQKALGKQAVAATADYKTLSQEELESAKSVCQEIGIRHVIIEYSELDNPDFVKNDQNRCFHCRTELAEHLLALSKKEKISLIVDGTNLDDLAEYRPGLVALKKNGVQSPLVEIGFTKSDVRRVAREIDLSIHDKPSNSCLASRIPWGNTVTAEKLVRIEKSEIMVKQLFGVRQVRVRDFGDSASIEVDKNEIIFLDNKKNMSILEKYMNGLGFYRITVDPNGYRPGKLNVITD
ncbi:Putative ATP-utilizing enzyme of the PP-loop superfamily [Nitrosotalea devaniterrae]|uniref:ATP-utilizing enzyme of the PP-loop superfamily n=1 Tax=Nitrosotalea devaniterrae TaxID=1078905 RepID=A0A128A139_9ARCH|nr:Putative ATP-utilizing enzyme of the PP-loop superfamily [Candidatus Nitrosotalea devanaterra]